MEDSKIIDLYWQRSEAAIGETAKKHSRYCHSISFNILHNAEDAEECVNDTYLNAWNAMPPRRVTERVISGVIAQWRGWSDEYLAEHFVVVKAVYYAEYDHAKTTRSDGDVVMYFYLAQDADSGRWRIVDNSGNVNWSDGPAEPGVSASAPSAPSRPPSIQEQIEKYPSGMFTRAYSPYYDGLHYKMSGYEDGERRRGAGSEHHFDSRRHQRERPAGLQLPD